MRRITQAVLAAVFALAACATQAQDTPPAPGDRRATTLGAEVMVNPVLNPVAESTATATPENLPAAPSAEQRLYLEVFVNGVSTKKLVAVVQRADGSLWLNAQSVLDIGLLLPGQAASTRLSEDDRLNLTQFSGVTSRYEEATQRLYVQAEDAAMQVRVLRVQQPREHERVAPNASGETLAFQAASPDAARDIVSRNAMPEHVGVFINHSFYGQMGGAGWAGVRRYQSASALFDATLYGPLGTLGSSHVLATARGATPRTRALRLDTRWSWFDPARMTTLAAGDLVTRGLNWSRALRLGGLQWRRNFGLRPDLITMPMLSGLAGSAAVPSTVELYINNARRFTQDIAPGPFALSDLPLITGAGTARLVVRDALGRETITETPFYASNQLLAPGLSDFAVQTGLARRNYGQRSNDYDARLLGTMSARYGLNTAVTLEAQAELGAGVRLAGAGAVARLGSLGLMGFAAARSHYRGNDGAGALRERGTQWVANLEAERWGVRLFVRYQGTTGAYHDLASATLHLAAHLPPAARRLARRNSQPARRASQVVLSLPRLSTPSLSLSYTAMQTADGSRSRLLGINLGQSLWGRGSLTVSAYRDVERAKSATVFTMLNWPLGRSVVHSGNHDIQATLGRTWRQGVGATTTAELRRPEGSNTGSVGWRVRASDDWRTQAASASYRSRVGRIEAEVERASAFGAGRARHSGRVHAEGALVLAGGGAFMTQRIDEAFGVVHVGAPNVPVLLENNPVGRTNARGQLLVAHLRPWERNLLRIDPLELPVDARIPVLEQVVSPRWGSGVVVNFGVAEQARVAQLTVYDEAGAWLAAGTHARLNDAADYVVGYDGLLWLEDIAEHNRVVLTRADAPDCVLDFAAPQTMAGRVVINHAVCRGVP